jgi:hypothetical protein
MLYTIAIMNNKPNIPDDMSYSWKAGGHWLMLVFLTDVPGAYLISHHKDWPIILPIIIASLPLVASLLYVRAIVRWIRGMDEMHRQITLAAFGFALVTYLVLTAAWSLLADRIGILEHVFHLTHLETLQRMPFANCTFMTALTYVLFGIGYTHIFNRRYQ